MGREGRSENPRHLVENRVATVWLYWWLLSWKRRFQGSKREEARSSGVLVTVSGQGSFTQASHTAEHRTWLSSCLSCFLRAS